MWTHPLILVGLVTLALPVVIHLVLRSRPQQLTFPALRFVTESHHATARLARLKHYALLALRMAALTLVVLILARPVERPQAGVALARKSAPAAAVLCFDTAPRMDYRETGFTRLDTARQLATRLVDQLPRGSRIALLTSTVWGETVVPWADSAAALDEIKAVSTTKASVSVATMLRSAEGLLAQAPEERREIYLFTDLAAGAWRGLPDGVFRQYDRVPIYILDVGPGEKSENLHVALEPLRLSSTRPAVGSPVTIAATVLGAARSTSRTLNLEIGGAIRSRQSVDLKSPGAVATATFNETFAEPGLVQGSVSMPEADPLAADNARFFTLQVGSPTQIAVVRTAELPAGVSDAAGLVALALSPDPRATTGIFPTLVRANALAGDKLKGDAAVFLGDAAGISPEGWAALERFVADGGGLVVLLGHNVDSEIQSGHSSYMSAAAQQLLGGAIGPVHEATAGTHLTVPSYDVPALALFDAGRNGDLALPLVYRWFELRPAAKSYYPVRVGNNFPALLPATHGSGRVYVLATAPESGWSNLAGQAEFVILMHSLLAAAQGQWREESLFAIGYPVVVGLPLALVGQSVSLVGPGLATPVAVTVDRLKEHPTTGLAVFPPLDRPGNYQIRVGKDEKPQFGFSLNIDPIESRLEKQPVEAVEKLFAPGLARVSPTLDDLHAGEQVLLTGTHDWSAALVPLLMLVLVAELFLSNRFYRRSRSTGAAQTGKL
jgi:hypothetical protein